MRCSDGNFYVVKFRNNPQHLRVLTNEMLATRLAERVGLPVPLTEVVEVNAWLVEHTAELHVQLAHNVIRCEAGLQFGSRYAVNPLEGQVFDYLPAEMFGLRAEPRDFCGNAGGGQVDGECKWAAGGILEKVAGEEIYGGVHRSGILFQCGGVDVSRLSAARACMRGTKCMRACGLGVV